MASARRGTRTTASWRIHGCRNVPEVRNILERPHTLIEAPLAAGGTPYLGVEQGFGSCAVGYRTTASRRIHVCQTVQKVESPAEDVQGMCALIYACRSSVAAAVLWASRGIMASHVSCHSAAVPTLSNLRFAFAGPHCWTLLTSPWCVHCHVLINFLCSI